jgi:hypothetical protein
LFLPRLKPETGFRPGQQAGIRYGPVSWEQDKPETQIVVAIVRLVPVAIGGPAVPGRVVPAPAADHPVRALGRNPKALDSAATQSGGAGCACKFNERFHVAGQFGRGPLTLMPILFVTFEFVQKSAPTSWRQFDPAGKHAIAKKRESMAAAVQLNVGL